MARILGASVYAVGVDQYKRDEVNYFALFMIFFSLSLSTLSSITFYINFSWKRLQINLRRITCLLRRVTMP